MATLQAVSPQPSRSAFSRGSAHKVVPFPSAKSKAGILIDTWITNLKDHSPMSSAVKNGFGPPADHGLEHAGTAGGAMASQPPANDDLIAPSAGESASMSYDTTESHSMTLLRKYTVHPTSSRRLQGLADLALMLLTLIPTALFRLIRAAMGFLGVTEHRWRGISMVLPLTPSDRKQLELTIVNLSAGRLGRRPEAPNRGPVAPSQQLLLDLHAILAAAASTAAHFSLPYEGMPEAALHAKLASYLRTVASSDSVCTQDVFKAMRKIGRTTLVSLCASAPRMPTPPPPSHRTPTSSAAKLVLSALRSSPSTTHIISRPKPRAVAKAFMAACLMQQSRAHPATLIQLVARLPDGCGDLVETVSLIPLAPGAEYLRLLGAAAGGAGKDVPVERFAEQLETMAEFGRLRPSDAKKEAGVQGMAINARVHQVGIVRREVVKQLLEGETGAVRQQQEQNGVGESPGEQVQAQAAGLPGVTGAVAEGMLPPISRERRSQGADSSSSQGWGGSGGVPGGAAATNGGEEPYSWVNGFTGAAAPAAANGGTGMDRDAKEGMYGSGGAGGDYSDCGEDDTEGLLKGTSSSQPELNAASLSYPPPAADHLPAGAVSPDPTTATSAAIIATSTSQLPPRSSSPSLPTSPSSGPLLYPTAALDAFEPLYGCPRSGAFAVHGRLPRGVGLSRLVASYAACHSLPLGAQGGLLRSLGFSELEELREEVELRKALCVAQALPVIVASLRLMCRSAACVSSAARTGSFLHVQQSLLSDLHRHERAYLEDTRGALDVLGERLVVRFVQGSEKVLPLHLSGSSITVSLPADCVAAEALAAAGLSREGFCGCTYGLTALLFNTGINSLQSLGFLMGGGGEPLQDSMNRYGLERLNEWAVRAGRAGSPALAALNRHCSPQGSRAPKDTQLIALVRRACTEVGAGRAVNCKSGKDRTALELAKALADVAVGGGGGGAAPAAGAGWFPRSALGWLEAQFLRGLSYVVTSQNHGQPPAYAFNEMEIMTLPGGWRPDWRLCGKVST